jgi:Protein of unknwon function (DUF3310)
MNYIEKMKQSLLDHKRLAERDSRNQPIKLCDIEWIVGEFERVNRELSYLTPGGSEYYNDPDRCIECIKDRIAVAERMAKKLARERKEVSNMVEENNNAERYDGDRCMQVIEGWPAKDANGNAVGAGMCISSIVKYLWRLERKGDPLAQLDKVQWYLNRLRGYYLDQTKVEAEVKGECGF